MVKITESRWHGIFRPEFPVAQDGFLPVEYWRQAGTGAIYLAVKGAPYGIARRRAFVFVVNA
ncbi:MAG TPA: hypothetical protein PLC40_18330 [Candidatus Hydrogenedentes bacterium]|nr:hypothetical protein [Candidatus Hydrogenedentota bacterium]